MDVSACRPLVSFGLGLAVPQMLDGLVGNLAVLPKQLRTLQGLDTHEGQRAQDLPRKVLPNLNPCMPFSRGFDTASIGVMVSISCAKDRLIAKSSHDLDRR